MRNAAWLLLLAGCSAKHEAATGREFFEKARAADAPTFWRMMSRDTQRFMTEIVQARLDRGPREREKLREEGGESDDPAILAPRVFHRRLAASFEEFRDERAEGDRVILVTRSREWVLVREDGFLKLDWKATLQREFEPRSSP